MTDVAKYLAEARQQATGPGAKAALDLFAALGLPTSKLEDWRYTDLRPLRTSTFTTGTTETVAPPAEVPEPLSSAPRLVIFNGRPLAELSDDPTSSGLKIGTQASAPGPAYDGVEALNAAMAGPPLQISAGPGSGAASLELAILFDGAADQAVHMRNLVQVAGGASLDLYVKIAAQGPLGWANIVNQIELSEGARLRIFMDIEPQGSSLVTLADTIGLAADARCEHHSIKQRAASLRHMIRADLAGSGADLTINGAALAGRNQTLATVTEVTHSAGDATSQQFFRNIVAEKGAASFQGRIVVSKGADGTDARQSNKNLLLHPSGKASAKPELLIDADDVQCAHGTSTGQLDEAAIFYLGQRGIPEANARGLLSGAFLAEIFKQMPDPTFADYCQAQAEPWLARHLEGEA